MGKGKKDTKKNKSFFPTTTRECLPYIVIGGILSLFFGGFIGGLATIAFIGGIIGVLIIWIKKPKHPIS